MQILDDGWDSRATLVDDVWLERTPRRPEVAPRLLLETRLLPWLAEQLPLPVPQPEVVWSAPLRIRHRLLAGHRSASLTQQQAHVLGRFLRVLHGVEVAQAVRAGVPPPRAAVREQTRTRARFAAEVLPRLPPREREIGAALLGRTAQRAPSVSLVHGDLGPAHVLSEYGELTGVIDWSDAH
ncbi:MAG TPA: phosphotransferase, partial [Nocardioidaceae bacterium]|nr:phosphotransferase [Nocardioidaceae bacterium]